MHTNKVAIGNKVVVLYGNSKSYTTPAKARKLLKTNKAKIVAYKPIFTIKHTGANMNLITTEGQTIVNLDQVCHIELNKKKIMFFFTAMTARDNWDFESEEEAKRVYEALQKELGVKKI